MKTIGVIGLGSIGMRHAKNLLSMGHRVIGDDQDKDKMSMFYSIGGSCDWEKEENWDAAVIATPTDRHRHDAWRCKYYGIPVLMEKPLVDCPVGKGVAYCLSTVLMVGYNLRFHGCVKKAKEWIDAGLIGDAVWANFTLGQHSIKPPYLRDGVILNWSHEIDLALYLLGPAKVTGSSTLLRDGKDTMTDILLTHKAGCRTTVHLDYISDPEIRCFRIQSSVGYIDVDLVEFTAKVYNRGGIYIRWKWDETWNDTYIEEMREFLTIIDNPNTPRIGATRYEGLEVLRICLEVRKQAGLS